MALALFKSFGHLLCTLSLSVNICLMFSHDLNEVIHFRPGYHRDDVLFLLCLIEELIILICLVVILTLITWLWWYLLDFFMETVFLYKLML